MPSAPPPPSGPVRARSPRARGAALIALSLVLATAACGSTPTPGTTSTSPTPPSASATSSPGASGAASGVRLARVGGVAGFQDVLVVGADGHVTGTTRAGEVDCTVPVGTAQVLATAAPPTTGLNAGNDRIATSVERDGTTHDLGEGQGGDPLSQAARSLLDDVQLPQDQRTLCRP